MTIDKIHEVLDSVLGNRLNDVDQSGEPRLDRNFIADILMDYAQNNKDRQFVIDSLQSIVGDHLSILELCSMLEDVDVLREGTHE